MSTIITNIDQLDLVNGIYTYADYLMWKIKDRVEILKGKIFKMSPAPAISHQGISFNLSGLFFMYFHNKPCTPPLMSFLKIRMVRKILLYNQTSV